MTASYTGLLWVPGQPEPKGSMTRLPPARPGGKARWINDNPRYDDWESVTVDALRLQAGRTVRNPLDTAIELRCDFYLPKPRTTKFRDAPIGEGIGDLDKLVRGIGDSGKKAGLYTDDSRITRIVAEKVWATPGQPAGARVELVPYTPPDPETRGPMPIRIQAGRTSYLVGSISGRAQLPALLRRVADEMERTHAA